MNKLVWKYFFEQKREEIKQWFNWHGVNWSYFWKVPAVIIGAIATVFIIGGILVGTGWITLIIFPSVMNIIDPDQSMLDIYACAGIFTIFLTGVSWFILWVIAWKPFKWLRRNWQQAVMRVEREERRAENETRK